MLRCALWVCTRHNESDRSLGSSGGIVLFFEEMCIKQQVTAVAHSVSGAGFVSSGWNQSYDRELISECSKTPHSLSKEEKDSSAEPAPGLWCCALSFTNIYCHRTWNSCLSGSFPAFTSQNICCENPHHYSDITVLLEANANI